MMGDYANQERSYRNKEVFVAGIPPAATPFQLYQLFSQYCPITRVRISKGPQRYGLLRLKTARDAEKLQALDGLLLMGHPLSLPELTNNPRHQIQEHEPEDQVAIAVSGMPGYFRVSWIKRALESLGTVNRIKFPRRSGGSLVSDRCLVYLDRPDLGDVRLRNGCLEVDGIRLGLRLLDAACHTSSRSHYSSEFSPVSGHLESRRVDHNYVRQLENELLRYKLQARTDHIRPPRADLIAQPERARPLVTQQAVRLPESISFNTRTLARHDLNLILGKDEISSDGIDVDINQEIKTTVTLREKDGTAISAVYKEDLSYQGIF